MTDQQRVHGYVEAPEVDSAPTESVLGQFGNDTLWRRVANAFWGYDCFISYHWESGGRYAVALAQQLHQHRFDCFLDRTEYAMGDDWKRQGQRALRNTQRLILIATRDAVMNSEPVAHEVELFSARSSQIIPIVFGEPFEESDHKRSSVLQRIPPSTLHIIEPSVGAVTPSEGIVSQLVATHRVLRRRTLRVRIVVAVVTSFLLVLSGLAIAAVFTHLANLEAASKRKTAMESIKDVGGSMMDTFFAIDKARLLSSQDAEMLRNDVLTAGSARIEEIAREISDDPAAAREITKAYIGLADHLQNSGNPHEAMRAYTLAAKPLRTLQKGGIATVEDLLQSAFIENNQGRVAGDLGKESEALNYFRSAQKKSQQILFASPNNPMALRQFAVGCMNAGMITTGMEAEKQLADMTEHPDHRRFLFNYANSLRNHGTRDEVRQAVSIHEDLVATYDPGRRDLGLWEHQQAVGRDYLELAERDQSPETADLYARAYTAFESANLEYQRQFKTRGNNHKIVALLAEVQLRQGAYRELTGDHAAALKRYADSLDIIRPNVAQNRSQYLGQAISIIQENLRVLALRPNDAAASHLIPLSATTFELVGDPADHASIEHAIEVLRPFLSRLDEVADLQEGGLQDVYEYALYRGRLYECLGMCLDSVGQLSEAIPALKEARDAFTALSSERRNDLDAYLLMNRANLNLCSISLAAADIESAVDAASRLHDSGEYLGAFDAFSHCMRAVARDEKLTAAARSDLLERCRTRSQAIKETLLTKSRYLHAVELNDFAWTLVTSPDVTLRDPSLAYDLIGAALSRDRDSSEYWKTMAVVCIHGKFWKQAAQSARRSIALQNGEEPFTLLALAKSLSQTGDERASQESYEAADELINTKHHDSEELREFFKLTSLR